MNRRLIRVTCALLFALLALPASSPAKSNPRCYGAASLDPLKRCVNPALRLMVDPLPSQVVSVGNGPERNFSLCLRGLRDETSVSDICDLGASHPRRTVALVGDSHSAHWRPAFHHAGRALDMRVISLVKSGCDYASDDQVRFNQQSAQAECNAWRAQVRSFLADHPKIKTVFFSGLPHPGAKEERGYLSAWASLPASVKRVGVIRDNPHTFADVDACIEQAIEHRLPAGPTCSLPRDQALRADGAFSAVADLQARDAKAFDFSDFFCRERCYPVVGGVLIYADGNHQTLRFNRSLAPYLVRYLRAAWPDLFGRS